LYITYVEPALAPMMFSLDNVIKYLCLKGRQQQHLLTTHASHSDIQVSSSSSPSPSLLRPA
jgi:hypothetical protein